MKQKLNIYKAIVVAIILVPNIFVMVMGIESFPYTCAPMFAHYIDDEPVLYLFKFEGENDNEKIDLVDYYGEPEGFFIRHFFSKVYGSTDDISPFSNKLSESKEKFNSRMNIFFAHYSSFLSNQFNLSFKQINLKIIKVDQNRNSLSNYKTIGYYDNINNSYHSLNDVD